MLKAGNASICSFRVVPDLPEPLRPLLEIANNLWWTWHPEATDLFERLDRELWEQTHHNPVKLLGALDQDTLDRVARDRSFMHSLGSVHARFRHHLERLAWFQKEYAELVQGNGQNPLRIAYFSAEFGFTECFQIYSGGLGCLAGDHVKSASELGLPLCGVGLLYRCGYFHQYLNADGWQQETYPDIDFPNQPIRRLIDPKTNEQYRITVEFPGRDVVVGIWVCDVGRIPVYLLDTNFPENQRADRDITHTLYGGDNETRIQQEMILGIGGIRALEKIGEKPTVFHINEGHAAFLGLERICRFRDDHGVDFEEARTTAAAQHLFTTHTPVPAGIDRFPPELVQKYISPMLPRLGLGLDGLLGLGRSHQGDATESFSMAVLALRTSNFCNGVSRLHGDVSRGMWRDLWQDLPEDEVPIGHVTNGVHPRSWISSDLMELYDRYLGPEWQHDPTDYAIWRSVREIPDEELWAAHERQRSSLITWCRGRIRHQLRRRGMSQDEIDSAAAALDPNVLTIGFARRFATYKRATLLMSDLDRLRALFADSEMPIQLLVAGKAHPADGPGKELIRDLVKIAAEKGPLNRIVFLEDYDIEIGRRLVQGCDIWLNTPRRGMEASGTSGMKAAMNGGINVSILDGWWDEAFENRVGFAIGAGESYPDDDMSDAIESQALYDLFERRILPEFYDRDQSGIPRKWIARMKACIRELTPEFSTNRMVADYARQYYGDAHNNGSRLRTNGLEQGRALAQQIRRYQQHWHEVHVLRIDAPVGPAVPVRSSIPVHATVQLGELRPEEVSVEMYYGEVTSMGDLINGRPLPMTLNADADRTAEGAWTFTGEIEASGAGRCGFTVRVMPRDDRLVGTLVPGLIAWHKGDITDGSGHKRDNSATREVVTT